MAENAEPQITPISIEVRPTAGQATEQYADIALAGLFNTHVAIVNSERQAIWQRYNVMLVGNAVIFAFLSGGMRTKTETALGVLFGLLLCTAWWVITASGWNLLAMRIQRGLQFGWQGLPLDANPFEVSLTYGRGSIGGMIYYVAFSVIALFISGYVIILGGLLRP
ncbi:MAG: hypothetical protein A3J10_00820 [Candidatus Sungbacteria bacterium RIFCSPLOWO2_02_FULL_54_10]|nr:MAG: hypothetical protein A2679_03600 [Candidatus Sungbacteria bacterium RIFCSPHIGHO2_01_FULL_54_26]OHA03632.1 MAG: hypothetical protein A3C92_00980 [Candidatus Sungbacteria bacterium RIFCSPHIGHO2_02_FULL_53_17]OHA11996.1 MAG: hypothetical protein A3J10_00820 [Candidatus Sungbacteria bacterium RIFCSPLOWO2_02_FULL_54_10]